MILYSNVVDYLISKWTSGVSKWRAMFFWNALLLAYVDISGKIVNSNTLQTLRMPFHQADRPFLRRFVIFENKMQLKCMSILLNYWCFSHNPTLRFLLANKRNRYANEYSIRACMSLNWIINKLSVIYNEHIFYYEI